MNLSVHSQIIKDPKGRIKYWKPSLKSREHYNIGIWIDGDQNEFTKIDSVEYTLHESFRNNHRKSQNQGNKFSITIWTYGYFLVLADVKFTDGSSERIQYNLTFDLPPDNGSNYVQIEAP